MDPADLNPRSPQDSVSATRNKWADYCRLALTAFRDKIYSAMSRNTVHRYAAHMQDMYQLTKSIDALGAHADERNKISFCIKRHRDQSLLTAMAQFRSHAAARRGSAAAQRLRHDKIMAKARRARSARIKFRAGRPACYRPSKLFKSSSAIPEPASTRQQTASDAEPASSRQQTASDFTEKSNPQEDELAQLRMQLARITSSLERFSSAAPEVVIPSAQEDLDFARAVQDSLGEAALSPARSRTTEQTARNEAQDQLSDQLAVLAAAKERSLQRFGAEKDIWDEAMHRRYLPAENDAPAAAEDANAETAAGLAMAPAASLLSAAKENSAFRPSMPPRERLSGLAESAAAFGPGLQHIISSVPTGGQASEIQLLMQEIASLKNEVLIIKNSNPTQPAVGLQSDFASLESQIMRIIDETHVDMKFEDFVVTQDVLKRCLRPGCTAVQIPGSLTCVCAAPRNMLDFKCPDPSCGMRQVGSISDMLNQYDCRHCFLRLPWSEPDPAIRAKIRQAIKSSTPPVFDTDPPPGLKNVFWTKHKVTQAEDTAVMLIRSGNSDENYMVAPDATSVKQILGAIFEGAKAASRNNILGIKIKSMHNAKIVLGLAKLKIGKRKGDLTPGWHIEVTELVSRAASHEDSTMEWSTQVLEAKPVEFNVDAPSAILILHEMFKGMTEYMCVFLGDSFAHEHHKTTELLIAAHYAEADVLDGVHVHFSIDQIITLYHDSTHRYGNIIEAYVNKSPFLHQHYDGDLLWSHIGTSARRPKYFIRSIVQGIPAWNPHIQITFFTSAQIAFRAGIQTAVEAGKLAATHSVSTSTALPPPPSATAEAKAQAERIKKLEQQLAQKDAGASGSTQPVRLTPGSNVPIPELQVFIDKNKHPVSMEHAYFNYPVSEGRWTAVKLDDFCPRCFRKSAEHSDPSNAEHEHKCSYDPSPNAPASATGKLHWNLEVVSKVVTLAPEKRVAAYKAAAKKRRERLKAKKTNTEGDESGSLSPEEQVEYSAFQAGDAVASEMIQQPTIAGFRATLTVSEKSAPEQGLKLDHSTDSVNAVRRIRMRVPSLANEAIIEVQAKAFCVGMDVDTPSGVQHHRCGFKAIAAQVNGLLSSTLFAEVLESSVRFLDAVAELEEKFEHLAAAEVVEVFLMRGISCHDAVFARHQPTSMFWLRTAFPRCLGKRPVLVTYVHEGLLRFQLYICAAGPEYTSELSSEVVHILVHEVHSYILDWECDWSSLDKVLLSLGKLHRFADVGINLCNTIERTLEAVMPTAPDYLKGAEMLTSVLDARLPERDSGTFTSPGNEVLDTIICSNLAHLTTAPYDGSAISFTEENLFVDTGSIFQELQAVRNVRAAFTNEYLFCRRIDFTWESCTAPIVDLLKEVCIISRLQQPIKQLVSIIARLMRTNVSSCQSLAHCRWIMAVTKRAWSRPLTTEYCCTLRPSLAYYSRLMEKVANIHPLGPSDCFIDLSFLATIAHIDEFDKRRAWIMLAVRMCSSHEQSMFMQRFNACAPRLLITGTPEAVAHESSDEFDMPAAIQSRILEQWSAYCSTIGLQSELVETDEHRDQASTATLATSFISRLIQCTIITPELAVPTLDIIDSHHANRGVKPPFHGNDLVTSGLDHIFEKLATEEDFELSPSPEPYPRYEYDEETESPQSESMSPIAARKVDTQAEPLDRYKQALLRNYQGNESHESWRLRVTNKFFQARSNHRFSFRNRASRSRQASISPASTSSMIDDSSSLSGESYEQELQGALGVGPSELAMVLYTGQPAAAPPEGHVTEFHNALPQELRLPSSAEVQSTAAGRTRQSTISFGAVQSADFRPRRTADRR